MEWNKLAFMEWNKHPLFTVSSQHIQHSIHCSSTRPPSHPNHSITNHQHLSKNEKPSPALQFTCLHLGIPLTPIKCNADKTQTHWNDLTISKQLPSQSKTLPHKECLHQKLHFQDKHKSYFPVSALTLPISSVLQTLIQHIPRSFIPMMQHCHKHLLLRCPALSSLRCIYSITTLFEPASLLLQEFCDNRRDSWDRKYL